ncbi:MAG: beta-N-acetylhexosaminidase [Gammaproteobacteria bacterium]|nr:beta-N-acetylhexosaminidase [Gammaproteobacteria bacterium]
MSLGPVMLDLEGLELSPEEEELLQAPRVGGVILFSRNYHDPEQLTELIRRIHDVRQPKLLIAVDHEGGRVQRFREGFTRLPAAAAFGAVYDRDPGRACSLAALCGWLTASELRAVGLDFSFSPVLDLRSGASDAIGDRAFHAEVDAVVNLARAYIGGMKRGGMVAVGKHFPGHGSVKEDSHLATPRDHRDLESVRMSDLRVFERVIADGLAAIMPAHVIFERMDDKPAGFSRYWLKDVLRRHLNFRGAVFSDDLVMAGAAVAGDILDRGAAALEAGCDMLLVCNDRDAAVRLLEAAPESADPVRSARLARLHGMQRISRERLSESEAYRAAVADIVALNPEPELDLGFDAPA